MKVQDVMTTAPETCTATTNLAAAAAHLWRADCGVLPVVDRGGKLAGIITDRDICIALGTRDRLASDVVVGEVMNRDVETCRTEDDVIVALRRMKQRRVRRLPVINDSGAVVGILALNDIVLAIGSAAMALKPTALLQTLKAICAHNLPIAVRVKADAA
jgi:CBS domain-containing protein